jgi:hypothetical protein
MSRPVLHANPGIDRALRVGWIAASSNVMIVTMICYRRTGLEEFGCLSRQINVGGLCVGGGCLGARGSLAISIILV